MFKRRLVIFAVLASFAGFGAASFAATGSSPFQVKSVRQSLDGIDRVFAFDVVNVSDRERTARGRVVFLDVYGTGAPVTVPVQDIRLPAGGSTDLQVRWQGAPFIGRMRALLVLNDGQDPSLVQPFAFWAFPLLQILTFLAILASSVAGALAAFRLPHYLKNRVPANTLPYMVEEGDTVVSVSIRFGVSWQDIVRVNRLKPPYALVSGRRIFIPKHTLHHRPNAPDDPRATGKTPEQLTQGTPTP